MPEVVTNTPPLIPPQAAEEKAVSPWKEGWKNFKKNKIALVGLCIVLFFILL
ncbi:ABC transporter permease, partial [Salmonella enterica]|nr:ABC transporter permease [Salmonella enterica subsp. enterica serovar Kentucky]